MEWLKDEVFVQRNDEERDEMDEAQREFEEELDQAIEDARVANKRRNAEAARLMRDCGMDEEEEH
jgi:hypothetical protein